MLGDLDLQSGRHKGIPNLMRLRRAQQKGHGYSVPTSAYGPLSVHHHRARVRAMMSACFIGIIVALVSIQSLRRARLPATYAICSREHNAIYTVDSNAPNVQCIMVSKKLIADRGSIEEIRSRWGDKNTAGPSWRRYGPWARFIGSGMKIYYLEPGEAVYPGFADAHAHILGSSSFSRK
jgi:hypothetical protein